LRGVVTGASSGIGRAIREELESRGVEVVALKSRVENSKALEAEIGEILAVGEVDFLVNSAGIGLFEPLETISITKIKSIIDINLTAPIILTKLLLPSLKMSSGAVVNITSIEALRASKFSAIYSASKAGLRHFGASLFEEVRKSGVRVCSINPDLSDTDFFKRNRLKFEPKSGEEFAIDPREIAQITYTILTNRSIISDITIRPQKVGVQKRES
jgi:short-subunit dehydrogenase